MSSPTRGCSVWILREPSRPKDEERNHIGYTMQTRELYLVTLREQSQTARNTANTASTTTSTHVHESLTGNEVENTKRENNQGEREETPIVEGNGSTTTQDRVVQRPHTVFRGTTRNICIRFKRRADVIIMQGTTAKDWTDGGRPMTMNM